MDFHDIAAFSEKYAVRPLTEDDIEAVFALCRGNPQYYEYCPPAVTRDSIRRDMQILPPGKGPEDKYFLGLFDGKDLAAVMDMIDGYPDPGTAYLGFFMVAAPYQHRGIGSAVIAGLCKALERQGFREIRLCRIKGNPQPEAFWHKNGFTELDLPYDTGDRIVMRRLLSSAGECPAANG